MSKRNGYEILLLMFIISYLGYPLFSPSSLPFILSVWFPGFLLILTYYVPSIFRKRVLRLQNIRFLSASSQIFFSNRFIACLYTLILASCILAYYQILSYRSIEVAAQIAVNSATSKVKELELSVEVPAFRYASYLLTTSQLFVLCGFETLLFKRKNLLASLSQKGIILSTVKTYLLFIPFIVLSFNPFSKVSYAFPLISYFFVVSQYLQKGTKMLMLFLVLIMVAFSFSVFNMSVGIDLDFASLLRSVVERIYGTVSHTLDSAYLVFDRSNTIDYPYQSPFYLFGPIYSKLTDNFISPGAWLNLQIYGGRVGGGGNPTIVGDYIIGSLWPLAIPFFAFLGLLKPSIERYSPHIATAFGYIVYSFFVDYSATLAILAIFLAFCILSLLVIRVFK